MQKIDKKIKILIISIIILAIGIYYFFIRKEDYIESNIDLSTYEENNPIEENSIDTKDISNKIIVYITGGIKNEGIYELEENSRIDDIIEKAGGLTEEANISNINLAYILQDGMKVHIPKKMKKGNIVNDDTDTYISKENGDTEIGQKSKNDKININTATQTEFEALPGIGPSTALKIVNYRKEKGRFNNIEDIKKVNGIGENKYNQIKNLIKT